VAALVLGSTVSGLSAPATWAATMDVGGTSSATIMAVVNMTGNFGAFLCPIAVGEILKAFPERWGGVLLMLALVSIAGGWFWLLVDPGAHRARNRPAPP
jgi:nitrate/nitrite transporter NarK